MAELMRAVADLPEREQNKLAAFLLHLRLSKDPAWKAELTARIDDKDPANWLSLEQVKGQFASDEEK